MAKMMCGKVECINNSVFLEPDASVHQTLLAVHAALKTLEQQVPLVLQTYINDVCYKNIY